MGEWKTVFENDVEGQRITVKVYESEQDEDGDEGLPVRVMVEPSRERELDRSDHVQTLVARDHLITLEPVSLDDLEEDLIEIGFSPKAAAWIVEQIPV